jgi:putative glutamine amidotransferase
MSRFLLSTSKQEKAKAYVEALKAVGVDAGEIRVLAAENLPSNPDDNAALVRGAAGLILCGGDDVEPQRYGETPLENAGLYVRPERDAMEWALLDAAHAARTPVFGVCRGLQVLNVYFGGTLWQDLATQRRSALDHYPGKQAIDAIAHPVAGAGEEHPHPFARQLAMALREDPRVNSRHHQAVKDLAPGLEVAGTSPDGLVEAFVRRDPEDWWLGAVQWHPENLIAQDSQRSIWRIFVDRAGR